MTDNPGLPVAPPRLAGGLPVAPPTAGVPTSAPVAPPMTRTVPPLVQPSAPLPPTPSVVAPPPAAVIPPPPGAVAGADSLPVVAPAASTPGVMEKSGGAGGNDTRVSLDDLLMHLLTVGGSDLHLSVGSAPAVRVRGEMERIQGYAPLSASQTESILMGMLNSKQKAKFETELELDFAHVLPGQARFRVNMLRQQGALGAVFRVIPWEIKSLESLHLPDIIGSFAQLPRGFVLVTGPTGSGKSTTLAAIIDKANRTRAGHIITIEDPIEFIHEHRASIINQREIGEDTHSFASALKHVLRQDPDIILVGELRDLETISVALTAAETGHLVFGTLHTQSAQETITRIIDVFPPAQQQQVRTQLAASLQAVVCQTLCKTADGKGRAAAVEIMVCTPGIRSMIRDNKLQQIQGALQAGRKDGMQTLNAHLAELVKQGRITWETGLEKSSDKADFEVLAGPNTGLRATVPVSSLGGATVMGGRL